MIPAVVSEGGRGRATNLVLGSWAGCEKQRGEGHGVWLEAGRTEVCFLENAEGAPGQKEQRGLRHLAQAARSRRNRCVSVWVNEQLI